MKNCFRKTQEAARATQLPAAVAFLFVSLLFISCSPELESNSSSNDPGFQQIYTQDTFTLEQRFSRKEITIAGQLELVLETVVPENTDVVFPRYDTALGDFTLKDTRISPERLTGAGETLRTVHRITYLLEPYLSGTYTIPVMTVTYRDSSNNAEITRIVTQAIDIAVTSLQPADSDRAGIKDIVPPLTLPPDKTRQILTAGLALLVAGLTVAGLFYWQRKSSRKATAAVPLGPDEIALQELDGLLSEHLLTTGEIKLFHRRISDILRRYIENRFGLKAPERTTEEFLVEISRPQSSGNILLAGHKNVLADFLTHCDLVKFARHEPNLADSERTVLLCREFIEKTKELKV